MLTEIISEDGAIIQAHARPGDQMQILWKAPGEPSGSCLMPGWVWNGINSDMADKIIKRLRESDMLKKGGDNAE